MMRRREIHFRIRDRIVSCMDGMSLLELSRRSGIPYATLHDQMGKPKFSVEVLVAIAGVLDIRLDLKRLCASGGAHGMDAQ